VAEVAAGGITGAVRNGARECNDDTAEEEERE